MLSLTHTSNEGLFVYYVKRLCVEVIHEVVNDSD